MRMTVFMYAVMVMIAVIVVMVVIMEMIMMMVCMRMHAYIDGFFFAVNLDLIAHSGNTAFTSGMSGNTCMGNAKAVEKRNDLIAFTRIQQIKKGCTNHVAGSAHGAV